MSTCERLASAVSLDAELAVLLRRPCAAHAHPVSRQVGHLHIDAAGIRLLSGGISLADAAPWAPVLRSLGIPGSATRSPAAPPALRAPRRPDPRAGIHLEQLLRGTS